MLLRLRIHQMTLVVWVLVRHIFNKWTMGSAYLCRVGTIDKIMQNVNRKKQCCLYPDSLSADLLLCNCHHMVDKDNGSVAVSINHGCKLLLMDKCPVYALPGRHVLVVAYLLLVGEHRRGNHGGSGGLVPPPLFSESYLMLTYYILAYRARAPPPYKTMFLHLCPLFFTLWYLGIFSSFFSFQGA